MEKIIYWNNHETILFAVEELRRLMRGMGFHSTIHHQADFANLENGKRIHLVITDTYNQHNDTEDPLTIKDDGFALIQSGSDMWIIGNEPRSVLYGMYKYCSYRFGHQWIQLGEETVSPDVKQPMTQQYIHEPMFIRRGNVIETINDPVYINTLVDWGVKNGQNEYFFTFFLWDQIKAYVAPELRKRAVHVTLGGHSLSYLLKEIQADFSEAELAQDEKLKFFAENEQLQEKVINKIVAICNENKIITRISLWPEDIGIDEKNASGFLATYIHFTEKLKNALDVAELPVNVEHIVYNAGLSWDMLERDESTTASTVADVLYAYWGRDYSQAIDSDHPEQERAYRSLQDWNNQTSERGRLLTVFEYYSDHFMLTELFPPLLTRIQQDLQDYKKMNINGVLNLIVPLHLKQQHPEIEDHYPWKWVHHLNNYMYARLSWGENFETVVEEYFSIFKEDKALFYEEIKGLELLVSQHTKWNDPLFPARIVDPEKVEDRTNHQEISTYLIEIHNLLSTYDLTEIESLIDIQTKDNSKSFTTKEMMLIYFYYLKEISGIYAKAWR